MNECPHCRDNYGYYRKLTMVYEQVYDWKNEPADANEINSIEGKQAYCCKCRKNVTKYIAKAKEANNE